MTTILAIDVLDLRFPTSLDLSGSDAMNPDGDYSAAYVVLRTDDPSLAGYGFTFTIGRGNELCVAAARLYGQRLVGHDVDELVSSLGAIYRSLSSDSQLRWLGPEKGVAHLALAAVMNACWDLASRRAGVPLWRLLASMPPERLVEVADFRYVSDVLNPARALQILHAARTGRDDRIAELEQRGYLAYTTSPGWIGFTDEQLRELTAQAVEDGFTHVKLKVGRHLGDDIRRCAIAREVLGPAHTLMIDANQVWEVEQAISWVSELSRFQPLWIEEPTSPDDVLGHAAIRKAIAPIGVASGEHCHNRVMFKQFFQAESLDYCQLDACRLGSINEIITVLLLAAAFDVKVCPHAGGVGLCELVQHLSFFDYVAVSASMDGRMIEYVDSLHEHFAAPVSIRRGRYQAPDSPGYSAEMLQSSIDKFSYPHGAYWSGVSEKAGVTL